MEDKTMDYDAGDLIIEGIIILFNIRKTLRHMTK